MDPELEAMVARASDPRWIPAIYNYCDRRCARCRFNDRCFAYAENQREDDSGSIAEVVSRNLSRAAGLMQAYAEREGINLDAVAEDPEIEAVQARRDAVRDDPLVRQALDYAMSASNIITAIDLAASRHQRSIEVSDAIDSINWLCTMIGPKICRALSGQIEPFGELHGSTDQVQNDANGSAKIARLMIADSIAAWRIINEKGRAAEGATTRQLAATLERMDAEIASRFPKAMEFVRPGFDEAVPGTVRPWTLTPDSESAPTRLRWLPDSLVSIVEIVKRRWRRFAGI